MKEQKWAAKCQFLQYRWKDLRFSRGNTAASNLFLHTMQVLAAFLQSMDELYIHIFGVYPLGARCCLILA